MAFQRSLLLALSLSMMEFVLRQNKITNTLTDQLVVAQDGGEEEDPPQSIVLAHGVNVTCPILQYHMY